MRDGSWLALTGQHNPDLLPADNGSAHMLQQDVVPAWQALCQAAQEQGMQPAIASAYRSFERQRSIWNAKASGQRPLLDDQGQALDANSLSEREKLFAMLRWSAIPGCSRHHWGTDIDIYDAAAVSPDYKLQLITTEYSDNGPFALLNQWLNHYLPDSLFFRPYASDNGGIAPERWHLSCRHIAERYETMLDEGRMIDWLLTQDIALKACIRQHWHDIFHRYVLVQIDK